MPRCTHCGLDHPMDEATCPLTDQPVQERGPCGSRIDRYEVERWLGGGGFGGVYRARHVVMDRLVALKVLHRKHETSLRAVERFFQEAKAAAGIGHPNIVQVFDAGVTPEGVAFLAMELVEGCSLHEVAEVDRLPWRRGVAIAISVLDALEAAHRVGIVHRDVKPGNIMLGGTDVDGSRSEDRVKLVDFGISKVKREGDIHLTRSNMSMGSPGYAAPEQYVSARDVDARADVYGMGVVLYRTLCGGLPFDADSYEEMVVRACTTDPTPLAARAPYVPAAVAAAVDRAITRERDVRHPSAQAFADALRAAAEAPDEPRAPSIRPDVFAPTIATDGSGRHPAVAAAISVSGSSAAASMPTPTPTTRTSEQAEPTASRGSKLAIGVAAIVAVAMVGGAIFIVMQRHIGPAATAAPPEPVVEPTADETTGSPPSAPDPAPEPDEPVAAPPEALADVAAEAAPPTTEGADPAPEPESTARRTRRHRTARRGMQVEPASPMSGAATEPAGMEPNAFGAEDLEPF